MDRNTQPLMDKPGDLQIKAWIINQYHHIGSVSLDIRLTSPHIPQDCPQMQQDRDKTHIGHFPVMPNQSAAYGPHQVATQETEVHLRINLGQSGHQVRGMQIARGLTRDQIIFHGLSIISSYPNGS